MLNTFCLLNDKTQPPASFDKSLYVGMYAQKLLDVQKYFTGLTNKLLYAWDTNTVYIMLFIWHCLVADLKYIVIVHHLKSICWTLPCSQRTISSWIDYLSKLNKKYIFQALKLWKIYKTQLPVLLHQLLHQQISFLQLFRTLFNPIWRKIFITNFPFFTDSPKFPQPLNGQNLLSMMKVFCWGSLIL